MPQTFPTKPSANYKKKQSFKHVVHMLRVTFDDTSKISMMLREQVCQNPAGTLSRQDEVLRVCRACRPHRQLIASNASHNSAAVPSGDDMFVRSPHQSSTLCWSGKAQWSVPLLSVSFWPDGAPHSSCATPRSQLAQLRHVRFLSRVYFVLYFQVTMDQPIPWRGGPVCVSSAQIRHSWLQEEYDVVLCFTSGPRCSPH